MRARLPGREERPGRYRPPLRGCGLAQCGAPSSSAGKGPCAGVEAGGLGQPGKTRRRAVGRRGGGEVPPENSRRVNVLKRRVVDKPYTTVGLISSKILL